MKESVQFFTRQLFDRFSTEDLEIHEVESLIQKYPYFIPLRFLKARVAGRDQETQTDFSALYFNNVLWYEFLLNQDESGEENRESLLPEEIATEPDTVEAEDTDEDPPPAETLNVVHPDPAPVVKPEPEPELNFEPYHTIDYFASQGIKLAPADLSKDKFGQQLKSFTEWLKSMKRLPEAETVVMQDPAAQQKVMQAAEHSIEGKEVVTETMAEVWAKQGNREKAREIYQKLSLLNPAKSSYFAAKIDELNSI